MNTITLKTILAAVPTKALQILRDGQHSGADTVLHLTWCYAMLPGSPAGVEFDGADVNRLLREFFTDYCGADGAVDWAKLMGAKAGTGAERLGAWTPEPWQLNDWTNTSVRILTVDTRFVVRLEGADMKNQEDKANAARIVACVNSCAGLPDPALELAQLRRKAEAGDGLAEAVKTLRADVALPVTNHPWAIARREADAMGAAALAAWEASK